MVTQPLGDAASPSLAALVSMVADHALQPRVHHRRICLFLGAGADISSGGLSFAEFKLRALGLFLRRPTFDVTQTETVEREFEGLFANLRPDERARLIEDLFRNLAGLKPSEAYKLIVLLVEAGAIDAVVTTNFDLMLETAQSLLGRDLPQVYAPGFARPFTQMAERYAAPKRPYLKLHGDLASHSVTALLRTELDEADYDPDTLALLRSILTTHDLIIAGYGGYDGALARIIADAIEPSATRIYWCGPNPAHRDSPLNLRCQTAFKTDPTSASNIDPSLGTDAGVALAPAELVGLRRRGERGPWCASASVFEAPAFVAGLDDIAMVGEAIEERGCHLGVAEDVGPFAEGEVGGDDDRGALVETADQVEQQLAA